MANGVREEAVERAGQLHGPGNEGRHIVSVMNVLTFLAVAAAVGMLFLLGAMMLTGG